MTKTQIDKIEKEVWQKISKEWHEAIRKFNKERIIVDFPLDDDEKIVKLAIQLAIKKTAQERGLRSRER